MRVVKMIEVGIDLINPIDVYTDSASAIMEILVEKFEGKCFRACYIEKIEKIHKVSECIIESRGSSCFGKIAIIFSCIAIIYPFNEVISGCKIIHKDKNIIMVSTANTDITMKFNPKLDSLRIGQIIPVQAQECKYTINSNHISVSAVPFIPTKISFCYKIVCVFSQFDKNVFDQLFEKIQEEEQFRENQINKSAEKFFSELIYPYKTVQPVPGKAKVVSLRELIKVGEFNGWYVRERGIGIFDASAYEYGIDSPPKSDDIKIIDNVNARAALTDMLEDYIAGLRLVREFVELYSDPTVAKDHQNLWRLYKVGV